MKSLRKLTLNVLALALVGSLILGACNTPTKPAEDTKGAVEESTEGASEHPEHPAGEHPAADSTATDTTASEHPEHPEGEHPSN